MLHMETATLTDLVPIIAAVVGPMLLVTTKTPRSPSGPLAKT